MTKKTLSKQIIEAVVLMEYVGHSDVDIELTIQSLLDTLVPKNRENFSKWGNFDEQSTPEECWD